MFFLGIIVAMFGGAFNKKWWTKTLAIVGGLLIMSIPILMALFLKPVAP
jgi:hypothetical protein